MGQKVDPRGIRIGITKTWDSKWFAEGKEYLNNFHEDIKIKEYILKESSVLTAKVSSNTNTIPMPTWVPISVKIVVVNDLTWTTV